MPLVTISLKEGQTPHFVSTFMDVVHASMVEIFQIPSDDKNIRVNEYRAAYFACKPPYEFFIEISMFSGRTTQTKAIFYKTLVQRLHSTLSIDPLTVFIVINDLPKENWGLRGGVSGADIQFGFKIDV